MVEVAIAEGPESDLRMPFDEDVGIAVAAKQFVDFYDAGCDVCGLLHQPLSGVLPGKKQRPGRPSRVTI